MFAACAFVLCAAPANVGAGPFGAPAVRGELRVAVAVAGAGLRDQSAAPRVIVIWGDTLRGRVLLLRAAENARIIEALATRSRASPESLAGRPFFEVAMFLPGDLVDIPPGDTAALGRLDVSKAAFRGRLYSPVDGRETLFAYGDPAAGAPDIRLVGVTALRVLRSYGLALRSVE
jgi:hypothetical protein